MTANPVDLIGGLTTTAAVAKADISAWAKARVPAVLADVTELRNTILTNQLVVMVKSLGGIYNLDPTDTTTADDGLTCIISLDGGRFKPAPVGVLAVANGGTGNSGGAWTPYTATLVPSAGTITQGGSAAYLQIGKLVFYSIAVTVTATTGSPVNFDITLPVAPKRDTCINGEEAGSTGLMIHVLIAAGATASGTKVRDTTTAVRAPTVGDKYVFTGSYEAA